MHFLPTNSKSARFFSMSLDSRMISSEIKPSNLPSSTTGKWLQRNSSIHTIALCASSVTFRGGIMWLISSSAIMLLFDYLQEFQNTNQSIFIYQKILHQFIELSRALH